MLAVQNFKAIQSRAPCYFLLSPGPGLPEAASSADARENSSTLSVARSFSVDAGACHPYMSAPVPTSSKPIAPSAANCFPLQQLKRSAKQQRCHRTFALAGFFSLPYSVYCCYSSVQASVQDPAGVAPVVSIDYRVYSPLHSVGENAKIDFFFPVSRCKIIFLDRGYKLNPISISICVYIYV